MRLKTTGCERRAKFLVSMLPNAYFYDRPEFADPEIYDFDDKEHPMAALPDGTPALAKVCAVDDAMGLWPRFQEAMHTGHSFQE